MYRVKPSFLPSQPTLILVVLLLLLVLAVPAGARAPERGTSHPPLTVEVVSSAPDQVTGGDARLHITVPAGFPFEQIKVLVNGVDMAGHFSAIPGTHTYSGVVDGLKLGKNQVTVVPFGRSKIRPHPARVVLENYPISGPIFSGPHQYPFICSTERNGLGQPLVDNDSTGIPVLDGDGNVTGYSRDCSADTLVTYVYKSTADGRFKPYTPGGPRPADMAETTTIDGLTVDYIVRWERGTINRFLYSIAVLAPDDTGADDLSRSAWNGRLIYHFDGGVGIGHYQGNLSGDMLYDTGLARGYAVVYSSGTRTSTHYNLVLGGETALMVKERFVELYDEPLYTVGLGGSGGGIQQYVYGQNHPGLIDAAIPQYAYPDMVTQTIHVGDCELLEFFMDVLDGANPRWANWENRTLLEGLNASNSVINSFTGSPGSTECIEGWRGLSPLALNPHYGEARGMERYVPLSDVAAIKWTHFQDIVNIVGVAEDGYARNYWDNVGVQYGLESVASGAITPEEFLKVNAAVGGWKNEPEMVQEGSPFYPPGVIDFGNWDPWSQRNQVYSTDPLNPAPRTAGDLEAMHAVYESGLVFVGNIDIPIIDWRHYLEDELNMHNSHQSFASRQRIADYRGNADNQLIWFTDVVDYDERFDQTPEALAVMDAWMLNILAHPELGVEGTKPPLAVDRCFDENGVEIAAGDDVWDGILNDNPAGACTQVFEIHSSSRIIAGGPIRGGVFKCQLKPVAQAIADGDYGLWTPSSAQQSMLEQIFPSGVCDYDLPDAGLPPGW